MGDVVQISFLRLRKTFSDYGTVLKRNMEISAKLLQDLNEANMACSGGKKGKNKGHKGTNKGKGKNRGY